MDEKEFEKLGEISFQIIANVGAAKSLYIQAIQEAKEGRFDEADKLIEEGDKIYVGGHHAHHELVTKEAGGEPVIPILLLVHAEDQLMAAETVKILALEIIELHKRLVKESEK
ncbi:MAG: PTS lactose/cellobiose transporter subunit IIA [Bifidobacteriaceae bacterium]|jgi:PTS system cellobiose-specific IIA component|nr:PTS lactose/cellobiose transporter subunit IIA [Bifidobacteriaceae bacterium]